MIRRFANRAAAGAVRRFRVRVDRFKLTSKKRVRASLLADEAVAIAVGAHATAHGVPEERVWETVKEYVDEIVPYFNILMYYEVGYHASRALLNLFYKVDVTEAVPASIRALPKQSIVVYVFNHRSNFDYVLAGYALAGHVSISYAVGEWARVFPLEHLFKSFGAYFVRRRFREPLYHTVLERYVQLITKNGVTQGIFPEGGLTRDGAFRPPKIGLLDYILGVAREPGFSERMFLVPVGINYDRVLEDRTLLRELALGHKAGLGAKVGTAFGTLRFAFWSVGRLLFRRWQRYGHAAVTLGVPLPLAEWIAARDTDGRTLFDVPRADRLARVQTLADRAMLEIGKVVPVTPVTLSCAAIGTFAAEHVTRDALFERMDAIRDTLSPVNARLVSDPDVRAVFDRAYRMLRLRRMVAESGDGYIVLPRGRELITYYANSIAHLLGDYRDELAASRGLRGVPLQE